MSLRANGSARVKYCRWFEVDVYLSHGGTFAAAVRYRFAGSLPREMLHDDVLTAESWEAIVQLLDDYDAASLVDGFPDGDNWNEHQQRLMGSVQDDWSHLADDVMVALRNRLAKAELIP